jgi:hypothetical protein
VADPTWTPAPDAWWDDLIRLETTHA